jgi:hypothetical protein
MIVVVRDLAAGINSLGQAMWEFADEFRFKQFYKRDEPSRARVDEPSPARADEPSTAPASRTRMPAKKASAPARKKTSPSKAKKRRR